MLLKKQTVWLLTMLSLVIVLSVYYIISPEEQQLQLVDSEEEGLNDDFALLDDLVDQEVISVTESDDEIISSISDDELFTSLRLKLLDERSRKSEELAQVVGAANLSAEERNEALNEMNKLKSLAEQEYLLETIIKTLDYDDVLVRADNEEVKVTVKADELTRSEANEILQIVMKELGNDQQYSVEYQPVKSSE